MSSLKYAVYCRKSSEAEEKQAPSIESQQFETNLLVKRDDLHVVRFFEESRSAKTPGRTVFNQLLDLVERGEIQGIIAWHPDRLSRNGLDAGRIMYLIESKKLLDLRFPTMRFELTAQGMLTLSIMLGMAKYYSDNLSENIRRGIRTKVRNGVYFCKAPLGYFNHPKTRTVEPDPELFEKVKQFLLAFSKGDYNLTEAQRLATEIGIFGQIRKKPLTLSTVERLLINPFYYGAFSHKGELHQGVHVPMVSKQTWDEIQIALYQCKRLGKRNDKGFAFLQFARCGSCGYWITAERHVKKSGLVLNYYRCTKKSHHCSESKYVPEREMLKHVKAVAELVHLPRPWAQSFLDRIEEWKNQDQSSAASTYGDITKRLEAVNSKLARLNDGFLDGLFDKAEFKQRKNLLIAEKVDLDQKLQNLGARQRNWLEPLREWVLAAKTVENLVQTGSPLELAYFIKKIGSNRKITGGKLVVEFKKPWNSLAETVLTLREQKNFCDESSVWWRRRELNPRP